MMLKNVLKMVSIRQQCRVTHINDLFRDYEGSAATLLADLQEKLLEEEIAAIYVKDNILIILI